MMHVSGGLILVQQQSSRLIAALGGAVVARKPSKSILRKLNKLRTKPCDIKEVLTRKQATFSPKPPLSWAGSLMNDQHPFDSNGSYPLTARVQRWEPSP